MSDILKTILVLFLCLLAGACATVEAPKPPPPPETRPAVYRSEDFVVLKAAPGDTCRSLARAYLGDENQYWIIQDFNEIKEVQPGQEVVIPLHYERRGGLYAEGYQLVPILVYHRFEDRPKSPLSIATQMFQRQMEYLYENGYRTITLRDLYQFSQFKKTIPKKSVIITIDDGYKSVYEIAYPILRRYGFTATLFVYTDYIGHGRRALSWEQLKELAQAGFDIQVHTKSHADLTAKKPGEGRQEYLVRLERELSIPRQLIKKHLGYEPVFLAYPYGRTNKEVIQKAKELGYLAGFTVTGKPNPFFTEPFVLSRSQIYNSNQLSPFIGRIKSFKELELK